MNKNVNTETKEALNAIGPSFEELNEENMLNVEGEITPTFVIASKVIVTAITGYAITCLLDD